MARQRIQLEITGDSRSVERAFGRAGKAGSKFGSTMKTVGKVAAVGFGAAVVGVGLALKRGFGELAEAQKVAAQTNAVLKSTGGVANVTAKHVEKLATSLSHLSGVDDEAIASGANMLLTFTNIRNGLRKNDRIFDMATQTVLDMSVAMGRDIPSTAIMVGKALNDTTVNAKGTITGWSALRRVGVLVSKTMMDQAAAFIKAGKPMEAQKLLLRELRTEFGGSAQAFGTTMPGALGRLNNALDEVLAAFATGFLPLILRVGNALTTKLADPAFVARVQHLGQLIGTTLYQSFVKIGSWLQANWPAISKAFTETSNTISIIATAVGGLSGAFEIAGAAIGRVLQMSIIIPMKIVLAVVSGLLDTLSKLPFVGGKFKGAVAAVNSARESISEIEKALTGNGSTKAAKSGKPKGSLPIVPVPGASFDPTRGKTKKKKEKPHPGDVYIDGKKVGSIIVSRNQRSAKSTSTSRRGPNAGHRLAPG